MTTESHLILVKTPGQIIVHIPCSMAALRKELRSTRRMRALMLGVCTALLHQFTADAVEWEFKPPRIGSAVAVENQNGCNWIAECPLSQINAAPEFSFPLQLIYHSMRGKRGLFSDQWFCPPLESTLLPQGKDVLVWNSPSGNVVGLLLDTNRPFHFVDAEKKILAKVAGIQTTITSNDGWRYEYRNGRLELCQAPTGRQLDFIYTGSVLSQVVMRDPTSNFSRPLIALAHDSHNRINKITLGSEIYQFDYDGGTNGRLVSLSRPGIAEPEKIQYNKFGVLASISPPGRASFIFKTEYAKLDGNKQPIQSLTELQKPGNYRLVDDGVFWYFYGKDGLITSFDRSGSWQSFQFSQNRGTETSRNSAGEEIIKYYFRAPGRKHDGKLNRIEKNGRVVLENFYNKRTGKLIESRDENGICSTYEYSQNPALADKPIRIFRGPKDGAREMVLGYQYDALGRIVCKMEPGKRVTRYSYNSRGEQESTIDPTGICTTIRRDAQGRVVSLSNGICEETTQFDDNGRIRARTRSDGQITEMTYDSAGNVAAVNQNGITVIKYERDKNGIITAQTDGLGRRTRFVRDDRDNLLTEIQPNGAITKYEYDPAGRRTAQTDSNGNRTTFQYDLGGHLVEQKNALGQMLTWTYDYSGRLVSRSNGVQKASYAYDRKGRLEMIDYNVPDEKILYSYDEIGRLKKLATPTNSITLFYDNLNRIIARQFLRGNVERVVRYTWDDAGRRTCVVLSEKIDESTSKAGVPNYKLLQRTDYAYDNMGRLSELKSNDITVCLYKYDKKGRLILRQYGNGVCAKYEYDRFCRMTRLVVEGGPIAKPLVLSCEWDNAGQLVRRSWNDETHEYAYGPDGKLLSVSSVRAASTGSPDTKKSGMINPPDASSTSATIVKKCVYDPAGNLIRVVENGKESGMVYNKANQLSEIVTGGISEKHQFNGAGLLESEAMDGSTKTRKYGYFDKLLVLKFADGTGFRFDYYPDGKLAAQALLRRSDEINKEGPGSKRKIGDIISQMLGQGENIKEAEHSGNQAVADEGAKEELIWDDDALICRNRVTFSIETLAGGIPVTSVHGSENPQTYFINDIYGTTLALINSQGVSIIPLSDVAHPKAVANHGTASTL